MYELTAVDADDNITGVVESWEADFQGLMSEVADSFSSTFNVVYRTGRSIDDALEESISGELYLFVTTCECHALLRLVM